MPTAGCGNTHQLGSRNYPIAPLCRRVAVQCAQASDWVDDRCGEFRWREVPDEVTEAHVVQHGGLARHDGAGLPGTGVGLKTVLPRRVAASRGLDPARSREKIHT